MPAGSLKDKNSLQLKIINDSIVVDLLKLDVEGVEFEILGGDGFANVADKIDLIVGERHGFSQRPESQLKDSLAANGFDYLTVENDAALFIAKKKNG